MREGTENTALLSQGQGDREEQQQEQSNWKNSVLLKTATFGANGLFFAAHLVLNGKYLTILSSDGPSASALMSTYQSVILGSGVGFLLGTGLDFGHAVGRKEYIAAGEIAKTATILSFVFGGLSAGAMFATKGFFPLIFEEGTAKIASDFFMGYAVASVPLLFLIVGPQIAFQEGDWYIPPASMFSVLLLSGAASYVLAFEANLGAFGVGLGGTIGSLLTATAVGIWSLRGNYSKYHFNSCEISEFRTKIKSLLSSGWKLAFQRLTEWGNLLAITTIIGAKSNSDLKSLNPAMLYLILFGTAQQGFAQAAGMVIAKNKGAIQKAIHDQRYDLLEENHKNNIKAIFRSNLFGLLLNSAIAGSFYLARKPLSEFFLADGTSQELELAENLLWLNMLGLIPDACRIIGAGALRGWKDLLYPTIVSFIIMTVIGIPAAYGLGNLLDDETQMMIYVRNITMILSASLILRRCYVNIKDDESTGLNEYILPPPFFRTGFSFFSRDGARIHQSQEAEEGLINDDPNL